MAVLLQLREGVLRRLLLAAGLGVLGLAAILGGGAALFLERPGLLLTSRAAAFLLPRLAGQWKPRWSELTLSATKAGTRRHRYVVRASDFCAEDPAGAWSACVGTLELAVLVSYSRRGARVLRLEALDALGAAARADLTRVRPGGRAGGRAGALRPETVGPVRVQLASLSLVSDGAELSGEARAAWKPGRRRPLRAAADLFVKAGGRTRRLRASASADADLFEGDSPTRLDASARAALEGTGTARLRLRLRREGPAWRAAGRGEVAPDSGPVRSVSLEDCAGAAPAGQGVPSRGSLTCALRARLGGAVKDAGLESLTGRLDAAGRSEDGRFEVTLAARTDPAAAWFGAFARAELSASGRLDRPLSEARLSHRVRATVDEARYEDVLARLKDGDWAIPAPFNALQGTFSAEAESGGDPRSARPEAAYRVSVRLAGGRQLLRARAEGTVSARRRRGAPLELEHEGTLTLEDAALDLPRLEAGAPPRVFSDPRIRRRSREAAAAAARPARRGSAPSLRWRMAVRTVKPVTVHSNLAATPVPVAMALTLAGPPSSASGGLFMKPFRVELFRRTASVRHLHVAVSSAAGGHGLDGVVVYEAPRARVTIRLLGTTERPRVELTSEPPLKREDIIALLIFNKTPEELDPEQSASVGNTESALESRAFGLASLYLFGATPVEHVGYDTASRTTTVKLRLPGGASLALGSDFDQSRELRLRKTLAPHWALESEVTDQGRENRAATTFLEWFNRY